jgi:signal transduction histidine kinase
MSIRLRLTLLYSAILALTLFVFGIALYTIQSQSTLNSLKRDITMTSDNIRRVVLWRFLHPVQVDPGPQRPPPAAREMFTGEQAFRDIREREIVRVLDTQGNLVASPPGVQEDPLPLSQPGMQAVQGGQEWWETATVNEERLLIYNRLVVADDQSVLIVQAARPLTEHDRSLAALSRTLILAGLVTILAAFGIGWVLSGAALRPIHRITQTAQAIGIESEAAGKAALVPRQSNELALNQRVDYRGPNDEIGQLATTFNTMLARLQEAYQRLSQALHMQRDFVADVSHELRTPLTTVRGNLALLRRDPPLPAEEQADILTDLVEESDRLIRLVNALLVLARADAGHSLLKEPVPVRALVEEVVRQTGQPNPGREIAMQVQDFVLLGDRDATKQVLLILLDNALKHSRGPIEITASAAGDQVRLYVRDSGPGMDPETLEHVFDRFYRGVASPDVPGFGLGLPIAKALVEGQGGAIAIASQPGRGSSVWVSLPRFRIIESKP